MRSPQPPFLSVIVPTYNAAETIQTCLSSVVEQRVEGVEILVLDGASTDKTATLARGFEGVRVWSQADAGPYDAMNQGIERATGDWVYFLGADDQLLQCLADVKRRLRRRDRVYYGNVVLVSRRKLLRGPTTWEGLQRSNICHQAIFYPRKVFADRRFNLGYPVLADWALNIALWHEVPFEHIPVVVALYSGTGLSMQRDDSRFLAEKLDIVGDALAAATVPQRTRRRLREAVDRLRLGVLSALNGI